MNIELPISLGEAIDKLTILDIKYDKISDKRKNDVKYEYELLYEILKDFIIKYDNLYKTMKKVNLLIWDMMDSLRDGNLNQDIYLQICKECIDYNDIRFRVKNKINYISSSLLKEQKSYKIYRFVIQIEKDITDNLLLNIIKYFSFIYDEIIIVSAFNLTYLKEYFNYDITIIFNDCEITEYKSKIIIENKEYSENELYKLFNINENIINKLI